MKDVKFIAIVIALILIAVIPVFVSGFLEFEYHEERKKNQEIN